MARSLVLDAEALSALAHRRGTPKLMSRARAVLAAANEIGAGLVVSVAVVAETARGAAREAAVLNVLRELDVEIVDVDLQVARRAGRLLHDSGLDSRHAVDAFVVATALERSASVIATADPLDITKLLCGAPIRVWRL